MKRARKTHHHEEAGEPVTRAELMAMLRSQRLGVSQSTLRRYQALGLIAAPRAYGRPGRSKGVTWGWTRGEAEEVVRRARLIRNQHLRGTKLLRLITVDPELTAELHEVLVKETDFAYRRGYADGADDKRRELESQVEEYLRLRPRPEARHASGPQG